MTDVPTQPAGTHRSESFVRGLTIGLLVGAAIAGSRLWLRLVGRRRRV